MPANPRVQLTRLALGIAGVAAVAGVAGRFVNGPAQVSAAVAPETGTAEQAPPALEAAPQNVFSWFGDDDDDDDDEHEEHEHKEAESHGRREGRMQFAQPGAAGASGTAQQQQPLPRTRSKHS